MARLKKSAAAAAVEDMDLGGRKVSVREVLEKHREAHGEQGDPPKVPHPIKLGQYVSMPAEQHAERRADFSGADLEGADLAGLNLRSAVFKNCNLKGADFSNANLQGCNFLGADMTDAILDGADLRWAISPNGQSFAE